MHLKIFFASCVLLGAAFFGYSQDPFNDFNLPSRCKQVLFVTSEGWDSPTGELKLYEKNNSEWIQVGESIKVVLGKNGLAWGRGLHHLDLSGPEKIEGDGRGVAGIFELGEAFGYDNPPFIMNFPFRHTSERDYWIDDINSEKYNSWVTISRDAENIPGNHFASFERMKRSDHLYEYGIIVHHNMNPVVPGKGSAIFIHVWRREGSPTLGCTAMSRKDLLNILKWLDKESFSLLIQAPANALKTFRFDQ